MNRDMTERIAWFATATEGSGHASAAFYAEEEAQFQIVYRNSAWQSREREFSRGGLTEAPAFLQWLESLSRGVAEDFVYDAPAGGRLLLSGYGAGGGMIFVTVKAGSGELLPEAYVTRTAFRAWEGGRQIQPEVYHTREAHTLTPEDCDRMMRADKLFRAVISQHDRIVANYSIQQKTLYLDPMFAKSFGLNPVIRNLPEAALESGTVRPCSMREYLEMYRRVERGDPFGMATILRQLPGDRPRWVEMQFTTVYTQSGQPFSVILTYKDVTGDRDRDLAYARYRQQRKAEFAVNLLSVECDLITDLVEKVDGQLPEFSLRPGMLYNANLSAFGELCVEETDAEKLCALLQRENLLCSFDNGKRRQSLTFRGRGRAGEILWMKAEVETTPDPFTGNIWLFLRFSDVDEEMREHLTLKERSQVDSLTGALTRQEFRERFNALCREKGTGCAFLMIDMDYFRRVNNNLGHVRGDELLYEAVETMKSCLYPDEFIGRIGGDEFAVALTSGHEADRPHLAAETLLKAMDYYIEKDIHVSASIGVALSPRDGSTFEDLYPRADVALYRAKAQGRNNYAVYHADMDA